MKVTAEARKAITESIANLEGETFTDSLAWELVELVAHAFAPDHLAMVSWDGIHDGLVESVDGEWETDEVRLRSTITDLEAVAAVVQPKIFRGTPRSL